MDRIQLGGVNDIGRRALAAVFAVWVALWAVFTARELFIKNNMRDYRALAARSLEEKRAYVTGERLYSFIAFCRANMPVKAAYQLVGLEDGSLDKRRSVYYLYPLLEASADPDYIFVFGRKGFTRSGYSAALALDDERYILKRGEALR